MNTNFVKDTAAHLIKSPEAAQFDKMVQDIENVLIIPTVEATLPEGVKRFCSEIEKNFERTATNLDIVATHLENAAKELRRRAADLRDASPDVRNHVERWISFERESSDRSKFLNTLFERKPNDKG